MKKRIIYVIIMSILLTLVFVNRYLEITSDTGLFSRLVETPVLNAEEIAWLERHDKKIIYGADQSSPPLRYVDQVNKQYVGFIVDYITALSIELGVEFDYQPTNSWKEALIKLTNKETDFFDMIPSEQRGKIFDFSDPVYLLRGAILVSAQENNINSYQDLSGKLIAVPKGDYAIEFLKARVQGVQFLYTENMKSAILKLQEDKVDGVVGDEPVIIYYRDQMQAKNQLKILDDIMYENDVCLAVPKSERVLLSILNKGIRILKQKDLMVKIQQKWFGISIAASPKRLTETITLIAVIFLSLLLLIFYIFYFWNRTLKKEVEKRTQDLNISRQNLQITFDGLTHLMIVIDRWGKIQNVNKAFCKLFAIDKEQLLGKSLSDYQDWILPENFSEMIVHTFEEEQQGNEEFNKKGSIFQISTFPLADKDNFINSVLIMVQDITQIRLSEQQLLQDRKMAAIGQLAAGVAHEIRNPLGLIRNYGYLLKNNLDQEKKDKYLKVIEGSVEKASGIINNLLNFSRISCNKIEKINMRDFMVDIFALEQELLSKNGISFDIQCDQELLGSVNQESLKHVMTNLISNAADAMPEGGQLVIKCYLDHDALMIECGDTGVGIEEANLRNIFNPFFTTKEPGKGVGLGLYITFNEVEKCGGDIRVSSKQGEGTLFRIRLPLRGGAINENEK